MLVAAAVAPRNGDLTATVMVPCHGDLGGPAFLALPPGELVLAHVRGERRPRQPSLPQRPSLPGGLPFKAVVSVTE